MLWRIQGHQSVAQLVQEVKTAFPICYLPSQQLSLSPERYLSILIESRLIERFLQFWGVVIMDQRRSINAEPVARMDQVQPLLKQTFQFTMND